MLAVCPQHCPVPSPEGVRLHTRSHPTSTDDYSLLAVCPQYCPVPSPAGVCRKCTWNTSMSTSEVFFPFKWSAQRPKTCKKLRLLQSYPTHVQRRTTSGAIIQVSTIRHPVACITGDITGGTSRMHTSGYPATVSPAVQLISSSSSFDWPSWKSRRRSCCCARTGNHLLSDDCSPKIPPIQYVLDKDESQTERTMRPVIFDAEHR